MLLIGAVLFPLLKGVYDVFTAPTTGLLVIAGVDEGQLAIVGVVPWLVPIFVIMYSIYLIAKGDDKKIE